MQAVRTGFDSIKHRQLDINILMVLAGAGSIALARYIEAATLFMLFSLSGTLENFALRKTEKGIEKLIKLRPQTAKKIFNGKQVTVKVEELHVDDLVRVDAYDQIPADGIVIEGITTVDESTMTGEAIPVEKKSGDNVLSGTQNLEGSIVLKVTAAAESSSIDRVISLVQQARANQATSERFSSWFGQTYTFIVISLSLVFYFALLIYSQDAHYSFYRSLVLLVALSPCALVISTPSAVLSAIAYAARHGILARGGVVLEKAGKIQAVALDKTGTLTLGKFHVETIVYHEEWGDCLNQNSPPSDCECTEIRIWKQGETLNESLLNCIQIASALEARSSHPLAEAIVNFAKQSNIKIPDASNVQVKSGIGIYGEINGKIAYVGREGLFEGKNSLPKDFLEKIHNLREEGLTVVILGYCGCFCAFGLSDTLRPTAKQMVEEIKELRIEKIVVLTGDSPAVANAIAKQVGIDEVHAGLMPGEKTDHIKAIKQQAGHVMMIGDGINDAPALAIADLGVAMGGLGSDVAIEAADIVLVQDNLHRIPLLLRLGRAVNRIVLQNQTISILSVFVLAITSLAGILPLSLAVVGHEGTTVLVILNGLRLLGGFWGGARKN